MLQLTRYIHLIIEINQSVGWEVWMKRESREKEGRKKRVRDKKRMSNVSKGRDGGGKGNTEERVRAVKYGM